VDCVVGTDPACVPATSTALLMGQSSAALTPSPRSPPTSRPALRLLHPSQYQRMGGVVSMEAAQGALWGPAAAGMSIALRLQMQPDLNQTDQCTVGALIPCYLIHPCAPTPPVCHPKCECMCAQSLPSCHHCHPGPSVTVETGVLPGAGGGGAGRVPRTAIRPRAA
jgi:hypothetical protein